MLGMGRLSKDREHSSSTTVFRLITPVQNSAISAAMSDLLVIYASVESRMVGITRWFCIYGMRR